MGASSSTARGQHLCRAVISRRSRVLQAGFAASRSATSSVLALTCGSRPVRRPARRLVHVDRDHVVAPATFAAITAARPTDSVLEDTASDPPGRTRNEFRGSTAPAPRASRRRSSINGQSSGSARCFALPRRAALRDV